MNQQQQNGSLDFLDALSLISFAMNLQNLQKSTLQNRVQQEILEDIAQVKATLRKQSAQLDEILVLLKRGDAP